MSGIAFKIISYLYVNFLPIYVSKEIMRRKKYYFMPFSRRNHSIFFKSLARLNDGNYNNKVINL